MKQEPPSKTTAEQMTDILDIEGIIRFPWEKAWFYLNWAAWLVLLALIVWLLWSWWSRRKKILNREDHLLPHEKAYLEIERLKSQKLLERGEFRKYYYFLSEILRRYLQDRFGYPALDKTTPEILPDLPGVLLDKSHAGQMHDFLLRADLTKFASLEPGAEKALEDTASVIKIVRETLREEEKTEKTNVQELKS